MIADDPRPATTWGEARRRLEAAETYWLATVRRDGRPHVMPVLGVWLEGALYFSAAATSRKAKNLARSSRCVITVGSHARPPLDLVVEGDAAKVSDEAKLHRLAEVYASKYGWHVTVRDGAFYGDGAPTAGPPPYELYEVTPTLVFGFPGVGRTDETGQDTEESLTPTRWRLSGS